MEDLDKPLVTVKCLVYNHSPYLRQCLDGMVSQKTDFRYEVIVHDDASTDDSAMIIKEYAARYPKIIVPILQEINQYSLGNGRVRKAVDSAVSPYSKYFAYCEGDDYWTDPQKLQKQVDFLEANPEYGLCYTLASGYIQQKGVYTKQLFGSDKCSFKEMLIENPVCTLTTLMRKDIYNDYINNIMSQLPKVHMCDYPRWLYYAAVSKVHCINEITSTYRILSESASHSSDYLTLLQHKFEAREISLFYDKKYNDSKLLRLINKCTSERIIDEVFKHKGKFWYFILRILKKMGLFK